LYTICCWKNDTNNWLVACEVFYFAIETGKRRLHAHKAVARKRVETLEQEVNWDSNVASTASGTLCHVGK
jgi:hypothetical protein